MAKKLLQEVMEEIRLTEKRLSKETDVFEKYSVITEFEKPEIGYPDKDRNNKFNRDLAAETMKSKFQAYKDLVKKLAHLKEVRDNTNMNTVIDLAWNGKNMTMYQALLLKRSISKYLTTLYNKIESAKMRCNAENRQFIRERSTTKGQISNETETYPLLPLKEIEEEAKSFNELLSKIDARINIANATVEVEI